MFATNPDLESVTELTDRILNHRQEDDLLAPDFAERPVLNAPRKELTLLAKIAVREMLRGRVTLKMPSLEDYATTLAIEGLDLVARLHHMVQDPQKGIITGDLHNLPVARPLNPETDEHEAPIILLVPEDVIPLQRSPEQ